MTHDQLLMLNKVNEHLYWISQPYLTLMNKRVHEVCVKSGSEVIFNILNAEGYSKKKIAELYHEDLSGLKMYFTYDEALNGEFDDQILEYDEDEQKHVPRDRYWIQLPVMYLEDLYEQLPQSLKDS